MNTVGERLKAAIERRREEGRGGLRQFSRTLAERGVRGSSLPSIYTYLKDEAVPSVDFMEAAADVLRVRLDWLRHGEGEQTESEDELVERFTKDLGAATLVIGEQWLRGAYPEFDRLTSMTRLMLLHAWRAHAARLLEAADVPHAAPGEEARLQMGRGRDEEVMTRPFVEALRLPLAQLRVAPDELRDGHLNRYVFAMCQALATVAEPDALRTYWPTGAFDDPFEQFQRGAADAGNDSAEEEEGK